MRLLTLTVLPLALALTACKDKSTPTPPPAPANHDGHSHAPGEDHHHDDAGHHGAPIALGEQTIGAFTVVATRDEGAIVAGKDAPIDATVTSATGAKVAAVRFWIGTEDAKGSVKARAEIEDPKNPNRWHTHAEIPSPLPEGSRLWVEVEDDKGAASVGSFDLKQ